MQYHSTRNKEFEVTSARAVLDGLCADGGLYVSNELAGCRLDMSGFEALSYEEMALRVFQTLMPDYREEDLRDCVRNAYAGKFDSGELTPVTGIGEDYLLELYHGPTCAFKDMALCMLPLFMQKALRGSGEKVMILTATSGDTGKAALAGFRDVKDIGITVFYPHGKVSDIQYLQMATQEGKNVHVAAVEGNFDDCQTAVKNVFTALTEEMKEKHRVSLSSANSINIGRLIPQVVYYIRAYFSLVKAGALKFGEKPDFIVPTGNFGDILAGYYAKLLGLPVGKLVIASNENKVLTDFFETGTYDRNRPFVKTISPSMDILVSSNLERYLYYASGMDADYVKGLMEELKKTGRFTVNEKVRTALHEDFEAGFATDEETKKCIREAFVQTGRLIDPHTAVGYKVCRDRRAKGMATGPCVILSTASPFKFAEDVYTALFGQEQDKARRDGFSYMRLLSEKTGEPVPVPLKELQQKPVLHRTVLKAEEISDYVALITSEAADLQLR